MLQVSAAVDRGLSRLRARGRLSAFLEELGELVGRDRDARALLDDLRRSEKLRGRLGGLFGVCDSPLEPQAANADPLRTTEFLEMLAETLETKDRHMRGHARRVAFYAGLLADRLNLSSQEHERVRIAAFLHDLGKVGVPTDLLLRAAALAPAERAVVERHPAIGARLLEPLDIADSVKRAIRHHHEWWNGAGYPDGLAGDRIPLAARIIGITDAFDAMTCDRPYREALPREAVIRELHCYAGIQFDPELSKEFLAILEAGVCDLDPTFLANVTAGVGRLSSAGPGALAG